MKMGSCRANLDDELNNKVGVCVAADLNQVSSNFTD